MIKPPRTPLVKPPRTAAALFAIPLLTVGEEIEPGHILAALPDTQAYEGVKHVGALLPSEMEEDKPYQYGTLVGAFYQRSHFTVVDLVKSIERRTEARTGRDVWLLTEAARNPTAVLVLRCRRYRSDEGKKIELVDYALLPERPCLHLLPAGESWKPAEEPGRI